MKKLFFLSVALLISLPLFTYAQEHTNSDYFEVSGMKLENKRTKYIKQHLPMKEELSSVFWPLYKKYRNHVKTINERTIALIKIYAESYNQDNVTNEKAALLMAEFLELDKQRLILKVKYIELFSAKFPEKLVWRFFHIESNLDTMIRNAYINQIPIVKF